METKAEHLAWCKSRALEYIQAGDWQQAWTSFCSDMNKHEATAGHMGIGLGNRLMFANLLCTLEEVEQFIKDFN